jgi:hypothetical protein
MSFDDDETTEEHERRITRCKEQTCRKQIIFLPTINGATMPVDADSVLPEDDTYEPAKHTSHFTTCNKPNRF